MKEKRFYLNFQSNINEMFSPNASQILYKKYGLLYMIGSLAIGLGFVNIVSAVFRYYLGHFFTLICIFCGLLITFVSYWLLIII